MSERPAVFTCIGDEAPDVQMVRAMRDALLLQAEHHVRGMLPVDCNAAIGLTGIITFDVSTRRMTVTAERSVPPATGS